MSDKNPISPPKFSEWLVKRFCRKDYKDEVLGDLHEIYCWRVEEGHKAIANLRYLLDAFSAIRFIRIQNKTTVKLNFLTMISLKVTLRTFKKNKFSTAVNLFGLACGFMVFLAIFQYVSFEKNYDAFNPNADNIYRVNSRLLRDTTVSFESAESFAALGKGIKDQVANVQEYAKLYNIGVKNNCVISFKNSDISFIEKGVMFATSALPKMLSISMLEGQSASVLDDPYEVIISKSIEKKYFNGASGLGKTIVFDDDDLNHEVLTVSGVFEDFPGNSHLSFDILISFETLRKRANENGVYGQARFEDTWGGRYDFLTYLQLSPEANVESVASQMGKIATGHITYPEYSYQFDLIPIKNVHTSAGLRGEVKTNVDLAKLNTLLLVGVFVLLLAWVNFINLTTANALNRAKETGVRKILGGTRYQLLWQFLFESVFTGVLAFIIGLILFSFSFPFLNEFLPVSDKWYLFRDYTFICWILAIVFVSGGLAGVYPALILSGFKPIAVLKGVFKTSKKGLTVRKSLVVLQAGISIFLITGVLAVVSQVKYMIDEDLGMKPDQVLVIPIPGNLHSKGTTVDLEDQLKTALSNKSFVSHFAAANVVPGNFIRWGMNINLTNDEENEIQVQRVNVEFDYLDVLGIELLAGRDFRNSTVDAESVILNESATRELGFGNVEEAIGKRLYDGNDWLSIIGVIADYHHESLKSGVLPMAIKTRSRSFDHYFLKIEGGKRQDNLAAIEEVFRDLFPGNPFKYFFLNDHVLKNYEQEERFGKSFGFFAIIAILISGIGLFSLSSFITLSRSKEIGIRKVLGARAKTIVNQLNKDFIILVFLATLIATPLSIWAVESWLNAFPYRISLGLLFFIVPGLAILLISLASVSIKTISASRANPVNLLYRQ